MFGLFKKIFMGLLINIVNASNHTKCLSLNNQKYEIQITSINLHLNEYIQEFHYKFHLQISLNYTSVLEVVILLMTYLIKCVF